MSYTQNVKRKTTPLEGGYATIKEYPRVGMPAMKGVGTTLKVFFPVGENFIEFSGHAGVVTAISDGLGLDVNGLLSSKDCYVNIRIFEQHEQYVTAMQLMDYLNGENWTLVGQTAVSSMSGTICQTWITDNNNNRR